MIDASIRCLWRARVGRQYTALLSTSDLGRTSPRPSGGGIRRMLSRASFSSPHLKVVVITVSLPHARRLAHLGPVAKEFLGVAMMAAINIAPPDRLAPLESTPAVDCINEFHDTPASEWRCKSPPQCPWPEENCTQKRNHPGASRSGRHKRLLHGLAPPPFSRRNPWTW